MTIRPMDLQVLIPKASEINRVNQIQDMQSQLQQQQFAAQFAQAVEHRQKQVQGTAEMEGQRIRLKRESRDRRGRGGASEDTASQKQNEDEKEDVQYHIPNLGNNIDIKT